MDKRTAQRAFKNFVRNRAQELQAQAIILNLQDALLAANAQPVPTVSVDARWRQNVALHQNAQAAPAIADTIETLEIPWHRVVDARWRHNFALHQNALMSLKTCTLHSIQSQAQQFYCFLRNQLTTNPELTLKILRRPSMVNDYIVEITRVLIAAFRGGEVPDAAAFVEIAIQDLLRVVEFWNPQIP